MIINEISDFNVKFSKVVNHNINKQIANFVSSLKKEKQSVNYYVENRNTSFDKAIEDIFLGKKAEFFAAYALFKYFNFPVLFPDLEIRHGKLKGWDKDLPYNKLNYNYSNVHVKSCSEKTFNYCNDFSWTFQNSNTNGVGGKDEVLNSKENDLIVLMYLSTPESNTAVVKAIIPQNELFVYLKAPKKLSLINVKKCIYYEDLIKAKKA